MRCVRVCAAALISCTVIAAGGTALAHGSETVGEAEWTVGWAVEPAYVGVLNAVQLVIERSGRPVTHGEDDLEVVVSMGDDQTEPLTLRPAFDAPGEYRADLIPTTPGDYTFRFTGTVDGEDVDESFTGSETGFDEPRETTAITFPREAPSGAELAEAIDTLNARVDDLGEREWARRGAGALALLALVVAGVAFVLTVRRRRSASA